MSLIYFTYMINLQSNCPLGTKHVKIVMIQTCNRQLISPSSDCSSLISSPLDCLFSLKEIIMQTCMLVLALQAIKSCQLPKRSSITLSHEMYVFTYMACTCIYVYTFCFSNTYDLYFMTFTTKDGIATLNAMLLFLALYKSYICSI